MSEISFTQPNTASSSTREAASLPITDQAAALFRSESDLDLMHYYRLLLRNLWKIILFSLVVGGFSVFYALSLPPVYFAKTTLLIESHQPNVLSFQDVYQVNTGGRRYLGTQLQILKSRALAERVVDRMKLTRHPLYDFRQAPKEGAGFSFASLLELLQTKSTEDEGSSPGRHAHALSSGGNTLNNSALDESVVALEINTLEDERQQQFLEKEEKELENLIRLEEESIEAAVKKRVVEVVMRSLLIFPVHGTQLVNIQFSAQDPQLAADISNAFADVYIESHLEAKLEVTQKASAWLSERLGDLRQTLRKSELALQEYRERERLIDTGGVLSIDVAELEQLTQSLVEASGKKSDAETLYRQMVSSNLSLDRLLALPSVSNNILVQGLIESRAAANRRVAELSKRYGKKHPRMLSAISDVDQAESELRVQVNNVANGVEVNYLASKEAERSLKKQIAGVKRRLQSVSRKNFSLRELEREVEANRQVYEVFLNRGKETNEASNLESVNARVIDGAIPADYPTKPEKKKIVMIAVLFSAVFAAAIVLLLDFLDNTIKSPEDVEERLRVPLLGHLPLDKENKEKTPFLGFLSNANGSFAEAVRTIRTSFILSGLDKPAKVTVVTSSVPNEGKSTVSLCLSQALSQMEKVLLIDADMRRPSIGKALDISLLTPGLSNLIAGTADLEECLTRLPNSEVDIITAGVVLGNPLDQIAGDQFAGVLDMLKEKYDRIIIDSAPIQAVSDSLVIASHADALIYVVRSDGSSTPVIKRGLRRLSKTSARFSGVVLNQVDVEKVGKESGYDQGYYYNYGYTGSEQKE